MGSDIMNVQQLAERVDQLEQAVNAINRELADLRGEANQNSQAVTRVRDLEVQFRRTDKSSLKTATTGLFETLAIQGQSVGIAALRQMMSAENLDRNELSRSIIEARDE
jgi:hypothetical protein